MEWTTFLLLAFACCNVFAAEYIDMSCSSDADCEMVLDATCDMGRGQCYCSGISVVSAKMDKCLPVATGPGEACEEDVQCSTTMLSGGACVSGKCACQSGQHYLLGRCWRTKKLLEACTTDEECRGIHLPDATNCTNNICVCAPDFYQREYSDCRPISYLIGDLCALNSDCYVPDSYCMVNSTSYERKCACITGESIPGATTCEDATTTDAERGESGENEWLPWLKNEPKAKMPSSVEHKAIPEPSYAVYGEICFDSFNCSTPNAMCTLSGYCTCMPGYYVNFFMPGSKNYTCLPELGAPCIDSDDCSHIVNSTCNHGICTCNTGCGASASRKLCLVQTYGYNRGCKENAECLLFGARGYCQTGTKCVCEANSRRLTYDEDICWRNVAPNGACQDERDCVACASSTNCDDNLIVCDSGTCQCFPGYHANGLACNTDAPNLDDKCTTTLDCQVEFSECKSTYCKCKTGYYQDGKVCKTGVGGTCASSEDCQNLENTICNNFSKCECLPGYIASTDIKRCLPIGTAYGSPCEQDQQCTPTNLGIYAACQDGVCACAKDFHLIGDYENGTCVASSGLGESCNDKNDCYLSESTQGLVCRNYKCVCDYGYAADDLNTQCIGGARSLHSTSALLILLWSAVLSLIM